ncbi:MAG: type VI secretion system tip protein VgrG [Chitinispirillaceae bacterium]|nr:type VI secretion system tip protein VgrG [Chitinispirillaceae bacterium]
MSDKKLNFFLDTPLGDDALIVKSFSGTEEVSRLYSYIVEAKSDKTSLSFDAMVGKPATLVLTLADNQKRYISGHVRRFIQPSRLEDLNHYHVEIVPWLWFLTQRSDCRIFQEKTALEIIQEVFDAAGFSGKYEIKTSGTYRKREFCVQYRETDFNFVSRLMEEEGIFYFFTHGNNSHKMVLGDAPSSHKALVPAGDVIYYRATEEEERRPAVMDFVAEHSVRSTKVSLRDYDFIKPGSDLTVMKNASDKYELYDYPGNYTERPDGEHYAKMRLEHHQSLVKLFSGTATERRLTTGSTFNLKEHPRSEYNATYMLTAVHHSGSQDGEEDTYHCSFECIPSDVPFRPTCIAMKPIISGCQTAVVTGPSGEEIWLDKYGRIKVQFHWDRVGAKDENSSCWIRVSRDWAGKNWGFAFHPRIGQEVIVQFIEGDVDRPIVTGSVYNDEQMPPYELPANSTQSTIKSRSSKDGTPDNFNEIRFEDKKGEEHFLIHAEKDHMVEVENDETHTVGHDRNKTVKNDETTVVEGNRTETVKKDETITIEGNRTESVKKDESITIDGSRTENVEKNETISITGNRSLSIDKNSTIDVTKNETKTVGENLDETVKKNAELKISDNRQTDIGKKDTLKIGKEWLVDVGDKIVFRCGDASITMKKDGSIDIKGKDIKINGSGKINIKASSDVVIKGSKISEN